MELGLVKRVKPLKCIKVWLMTGSLYYENYLFGNGPRNLIGSDWLTKWLLFESKKWTNKCQWHWNTQPHTKKYSQKWTLEIGPSCYQLHSVHLPEEGKHGCKWDSFWTSLMPDEKIYHETSAEWYRRIIYSSHNWGTKPVFSF